MRLPAKVNRLVGQAMHDYAMLTEGDRVLVAVSGGVDSLVLIHLLHYWLRKAPVRYWLTAVHVDMEGSVSKPGTSACTIRDELARKGLELEIIFARRAGSVAAPDELGKSDKWSDGESCFTCARARRAALFDEAARLDCNKIAFGHHQDDLIETFLLNLTCAGNISTMLPRQDIFQGRLALIRPLAYVEKQNIEQIAQDNGLNAVPSSCPLAGRTRRDGMQALAAEIYRRIPGAKKNIFSALGNVRNEYLPTGRQAKQTETRTGPDCNPV
ncbi:MAG: PP-loop domain-containing protein [Desulfobulbaceae bacterium]|nr:PP-loop domain-containing protein [Desulfobulbaceae bacterium]